MSLKARLYIWFTVGLGAFVSYWYLPGLNYEGYNLPIIGLLALFALLSEIFYIEIIPGHGISVSTAIYRSAIYIGGASLSIFIALPALVLSETILRGWIVSEGTPIALSFKKALFNIAQIIVALGAAGAVFSGVGGHTVPFTTAYDYFPPLLAFLTFILVNKTLVSGVISLVEGENFLYQLKLNLENLHLQSFSLAIISLLIAITYSYSPWTVFLVAALLVLVNASLRNYVDLQSQAKQAFEKIMDLLEKRDPYTHKHSESVGNLSESIAKEMKISPNRKEDIVSAARVHDIGKLGIPDSILLKNGELDDDEWKQMKEHPVLGADILDGLTIYENAVDIVRYEHERWDGSGYPEGLEGEEIPLGSRIVAVADVWNALRTKRPYRGPLPKKEAKKEMEKMSGEKLDSEVVDSLLGLVEKGEVEVAN